MPKALHILILPLMAFLILLLTSVPAISEQVSTVRVGGLEFEPYIMIHADGTTQGIIADLVRLALKEAGYQTKFEITNWARAFTEVKKGLTDAIIPAMKSADREVFLYYPTQPVVHLQMVLITAKGNSVTFDGTMASLRHYSIGRVRQARVSPAFDKAREEGIIQVQERNSFELLVKAAAFGRIDLAAVEKLVAFWSAQKHDLRYRIRVLEPILGSVPVYVAFSKKRLSQKTARDVGNILEQFHQDGTVDKLIQQYLDSHTENNPTQ